MQVGVSPDQHITSSASIRKLKRSGRGAASIITAPAPSETEPAAEPVPTTAPDPCDGAPMGRQWFPLTLRDPAGEEAVSESLQAAESKIEARSAVTTKRMRR